VRLEGLGWGGGGFVGEVWGLGDNGQQASSRQQVGPNRDLVANQSIQCGPC
jgi:hypothetical protein